MLSFEDLQERFRQLRLAGLESPVSSLEDQKDNSNKAKTMVPHALLGLWYNDLSKYLRP